MDISAIRAAIAAAVDSISGLNCLGYVPDAVPAPCFYTDEVEIEFDKTFGRGLDELEFICRLLVSRSDDRASQKLLDSYLKGSGATSVKAALEAARGAPGQYALGGLADDLHLTRVRGYRWYTHGESKYIGAEFVVRVIGSGA